MAVNRWIVSGPNKAPGQDWPPPLKKQGKSEQGCQIGYIYFNIKRNILNHAPHTHMVAFLTYQ